MSSPLDALNDRQREAASTIEGPLLVLAGAGTGKTKVITCRIAYMIDQGVAPSSILGVTFTNKAAKEMRERLDKMVHPSLSKLVTLGTFHSFCARILHKYIHLAGHYNSSYSIADDADQTALVRQAAAELGYAKDEIDSKKALAYICNSLLTPWRRMETIFPTMPIMPGSMNVTSRCWNCRIRWILTTCSFSP